jgi:16S rRNA (uracil1498-N3)-methyltransferase
MNRPETRERRSPRLYVATDFTSGARIALDRAQAHYLKDVLRLADGDSVLVFNGRDGEWQAAIEAGKRDATLILGARLRAQQHLPNVRYAFAPLKHARLDYMVQKAVEMGASALLPVITRRTQAARVNTERMRANVIEAAEQCGILALAEVAEPVTLERFLAERDGARLLIFCDEETETASPLAALAGKAHEAVDVVIGPEGGFADDERTALLRQPNVLRLSLGPRILRADTAAVAALALIQATLGDWNKN